MRQRRENGDLSSSSTHPHVYTLEITFTTLHLPARSRSYIGSHIPRRQRPPSRSALRIRTASACNNNNNNVSYRATRLSLLGINPRMRKNARGVGMARWISRSGESTPGSRGIARRPHARVILLTENLRLAPRAGGEAAWSPLFQALRIRPNCSCLGLSEGTSVGTNDIFV